MKQTLLKQDRTHNLESAPPVVSSRKKRPHRLLPPITVGLVLLLTWEVTTRLGPGLLMPSPVGIIISAPTVLTSFEFWEAVGRTSLAVAEGLLIGCSTGTILGILIGRVHWLRSLTAPYVLGLYAMPLLALIPLLTIWLGYSSQARLAVVIFAAILPSIVSTADGARQLPRELVDVMTVLGASRIRILRDLVFPSTVPFIMAGINVAIGRALVGAIAIEFLASVPGLGTFILVNARSFNQNEAFLGVILLVILGLVAHIGVERLRRHLAPWQ